MAAVHRSPFCGTWFPDDRAELSELLDQVFHRSAGRTAPAFPSEPLAVVVPHASPVYSGSVAAAAYRCLMQRRLSRAVLLGFSHRRPHHGIGIPDVHAYHTPFGEVEVDHPVVRSLGVRPPFRSMPEAALCDHSVEVQLPFLKRALPGARLVPLYVGELTAEERGEAASVLASLLDAETAFLASSDFTHFGARFRFTPFPADASAADRLRDLDAGVIAGAGSLDAAVFHRELEATGSNTCGRAPLALLAETLRLATGGEVFQDTLDYESSGHLTGDWSHTVGYAALGYFRAASFQVEETDRRALLGAAQRVLHGLERGLPEEPVRADGGTPAIERRAGVFVTLYQRGELRGCVGNLVADRPLAESVPHLTLAAATEDPRFPPVRPGETGFRVSLSVLTPPKLVAAPDHVMAGQHGVLLESDERRALLLPQVAERYGWDRSQFLEAVARKAGLPPSAVAGPQTRLSVFRAQVFGDGGAT